MIQGELGNPGLEAFLQQHRSLLSADLVLAATGAPTQGEQGGVEALPNTPGNRLALEVWSQVFGKAREFNRCAHVDRCFASQRTQVYVSWAAHRSYLRCGIGSKTVSPIRCLHASNLMEPKPSAPIHRITALVEFGVSCAILVVCRLPSHLHQCIASQRWLS